MSKFVKIEDMKISDSQEVTDLALQLGYPLKASEVEKRIEEILPSPWQQLYVARREDGSVCGWVQVQRERETLLAEPRAEVVALVVDAQERGAGIGKVLLEKAEEWATEHRLGLMRVRSNTLREKAHRFYLREGYEIKKSWHLFTKSMDS